MSASNHEGTWDRRRGDRRAGSPQGDRRLAESPAGRFEAYLDIRLGALELAAAEAIGDVGAEAARIRDEPGSDALDAEMLGEIASRASRAVDLAAQEIARLRDDFRTSGASSNGLSAPSEGAEMLVRQMAIAGADAAEIEQELASLGMEHPRNAIKAVLAEPQ